MEYDSPDTKLFDTFMITFLIVDDSCLIELAKFFIFSGSFFRAAMVSMGIGIRFI